MENYTYNATGDRLSKALNGAAAQTYAYSSPLTSHRLQSVAGTARSYDNNGNTTQIASNTFTYDNRNRLTSAGGATYDYNGRGERVMKSSSSNADANARYAYSTSGQLLAEYQYTYICQARPHSQGCSLVQAWLPKMEYVWLDGTLVGVVTNAAPYLGPGLDPVPTQLYYAETDQLGTPRKIVQPGDDTSGDVVVWSWDYFANAFGDASPNEDPDGDGTAFTFNLRYPGQYFDQETGLNYNYFRDYESTTGRYIESDPIGLWSEKNVSRGASASKGSRYQISEKSKANDPIQFYLGSNTYNYVLDNPVKGIDPRGLYPCHLYKEVLLTSFLMPSSPVLFRISLCEYLCGPDNQCSTKNFFHHEFAYETSYITEPVSEHMCLEYPT